MKTVNILVPFDHFPCKKIRKPRPEVFHKKGVLRNFTKFTGKHLCQSLFFNKVAGPATLFKKRLCHSFFPVSFVKLLRTPFFYRTPLVAASVNQKFWKKTKMFAR